MKKNYIYILVTILFLSAFTGYFFIEKYNIKNVEILKAKDGDLQTWNLQKAFPLSLEFGHKKRLWLNDDKGFSGVFSGEGVEVMTKKATTTNELNFLNVFVDKNLTDMVFTESHAFSNDAFVFATSDGKIYGWHKNLQTGIEDLYATLRVDNSKEKSSYTGATALRTKEGYRLYVADFTNGKIDIFDTNYKKINNNNFANFAEGFKPFSLKALNGRIYISLINNQENKSKINVYDENGIYLETLNINRLEKPWGMTIVNSDFGKYKNNLLIGDFQTGKIAIYDLANKKDLGDLKNIYAKEIVISNLGAINFGSNNGAGKDTELFYARFPTKENKTLFGKFIYE
jgi:uncharacterized protein (TIGR03118 family)